MLSWDVGFACLCCVVPLTATVCIQHASPCICWRFASKQKSLLILLTRLWWSLENNWFYTSMAAALFVSSNGEAGRKMKSVWVAMNFTVGMRCKSLLPIFQMPLERTKSWIVIMHQDDQRRYRSHLCTLQHTGSIVTALIVYETMSFYQWNKHC